MGNDLDNYYHYFEIDEGYYPEINESSIKDENNRWQSTYPHKDIVKLLHLLERSLSRSEKKSLWIEGSYGTGKSRILWMMQNLLSCSEAEFDAYFAEYKNLSGEIDLRERLRTIRKGGIVTAARYSTGEITSTRKLVFAVYESLSSALKQNDCKFDGAKTLRGKIASWLESDKANLELFRAKIQKPEYRMSATLANRTAEEIIERLKNPNAEVANLVEDILQLGENEGILAFNIDMKDLLGWIEEVIAENHLKAILLFWDEFSKFFGNNRNNLDEFQRLAELSNIAPFYLVIATHESGSLAGEGDQAFRIVSDRFVHANITMPDNIAFELIGHALKVKDVAKDTWNNISKALIERTAEPRKAVMKFASIQERDEKILTSILPIHPTAAILLKNLASYFASNQRSIFNFIKNADPNIKAFQDFIANHSPMNGDLLTVDHLWNFFYESGTDEHGGNVGRMNLKPSIRSILDSYSLSKNELSLDEQTVLKTILLFQAIDQESHNSVDIFRPSEKNLELAFAGVDKFENGRAVDIANNLVRKNILFKRPGSTNRPETFASATASGDVAEIERQKKHIRENVQTVELVDKANLVGVIRLTDSQKARYDLIPVAANNFTAVINKITNQDETYKIKVVVCFARNEDEQNKMQNLIHGAIQDERYHKLVFIDASSNSIRRDVFNRWVENSANAVYWRGKDNDFANKMESNAADCLKEWFNSFETSSFVYYPAVKNANVNRQKISCQNADQVTDELKDNVRRIYPYSFDDANITNTLFLSTNVKRLAEAGIKQETFSMLQKNSIRIVFGDLWQMSKKYWEVYPDLSISRLKIELDRKIADELKKNSRISFDKIIAYLLENGFMPLNIYACLTGFLLKEYAVDPYRFSSGIDGSLGGAMNAQKLAECINDSIKQVQTPAKNYRPKYLEIMSQNQRQFMLFVREIFGVDEDISVEQSVQKLRLKLKNLNYPLWCYVDASEDEYKNFLEQLMETVRAGKDVAISKWTEEVGQFLTDNPKTFHDMKNFLTERNGREIFTDFVKNFDDGIIFELTQKIGIDNPVSECQSRITSGDGIWLRDKETAVDDLKKLVVDYKIIVESQKFGIRGKSFSACVKSWVDYCRFNLKIPADLLGDYYPKAKNFFGMLKEMAERGEIYQNSRENFLRQMVDNADIILDAISDPIKILRDKYDYQLDGLNDDEIQKLVSSLSSSAFTDSQARYMKAVDECAKKIRSENLKDRLLKLWRELTKTNSPRDWSKDKSTPILAMVPKSERDNARKVFETIMTSSPDEKDVRFAIDYLEKRPNYLNDLDNEQKIEQAFRDSIIDEEYRILIDDNAEIRDELYSKSQNDPYQWYSNIRVKEIVKKFVENKYYTGETHDKVTTKVMKMSDVDAKNLLIELLDKNFEVGLKILRES